MNPETTATIRNKLQAAITALESIQKNKSAPDNLIKIALEDLRKVLELI